MDRTADVQLRDRLESGDDVVGFDLDAEDGAVRRPGEGGKIGVFFLDLSSIELLNRAST
jgi:hypothetical protein